MPELRGALSPGELAEMLGLHVGTLENWRREGVGPSFIRMNQTPRGRVRYLREDIDAWIAANKSQTS